MNKENLKDQFEEALKARIRREGYFTLNEWHRKATTHNLLQDVWAAILTIKAIENDK